MIRNISVGIDVGSATTRVVVGEFVKGEKIPKVIGAGEAPSWGLRHGYVTHYDDALTSVKKAVAEAEKTSGIKIKRAYVAVSGVTLRGDTSIGTAVISKADGEVTNLDVNKALEEAEGNLSSGNRKVIQVSPVSFKLDGKEVFGRPEGMRGNKLEVRALFVTYSLQHLEDLIEVISAAGVEPIDIVPAPVAGASVVLSEKQKIVGAAVGNIGAESTSLAVFENGTLLSLDSFSIGASEITNDIALGLKISLEEAESLKVGNTIANFSKKKLDEIVEARLSDIFELVGNHLKKIKRNELLPAGIIWTGGGANTEHLEALSKSALSLPSRIGTADMFANQKTRLRDPAWFTAVGLVMTNDSGSDYSKSSMGGIFKDLKRTIKSITKQFLP